MAAAVRAWIVTLAAAVGLAASSCMHSGTRPIVGGPPAAGTATMTSPSRPVASSPAFLVAVSPDGTRIAYQTHGTGPPLLLLHGSGQTRRSWNDRGYVDRLSKSFTVITMDQRGSGDSDKPATIDAYDLDRVLADVLAVADATGASEFQVWGFGRGATVARYLAARSDRVASAVLVGAPMGPPVTETVKGAMTSMRDHWWPLLKAKQAGRLDVESLSPGDRATLAGDTPITALVLGALVDFPPLEPEAITAPTLWVVGSEDAALLANAKQYEKRLAGTSVTLKILTGESYTDCFAKSIDMIAAIEPFLVAHAEGPSDSAGALPVSERSGRQSNGSP